MSRTHPEIIAIENNHEAYLLWKKKKIIHATVLHIDAHLDYRSDDTKIHIGNYVKQAIADGMIDTLYWIVPGSLDQFIKEETGIKAKLRAAGIAEKIIKTKAGLRTSISKATVIVCPIGLLPQTMSSPCIIDVDLDFLFFPSAATADRTEHIGKRKPWMSPEQLAKIIGHYIGKSVGTTLCYSTTGGWTPMRYRHLGDQILESLGLKSGQVHQRIVAGTFFESFSRYFDKNEIQKAKKYYQSALAMNPSYLNFYMTDGPLFLLKGDLKNAEKQFSRLRTIDSQNPYSLFGLGLVKLLSGDLKKAKYFFQKAQSITNTKDVSLFLIYIQSHLGEHEMVKQLLQDYKRNSFPMQPLSENVLHRILNEISEKLKNESQRKSIGQMYLYPNKKAVSVWEELTKYSPNNIGNWTEEPAQLRHTAAAIELDIIEKMTALYFDNNKKYGGYITTGATEGNIFSAWIGRKYLEKKSGKSQIVLLANNLTHYSILKAADVTGVTVKNVRINTTNWNTDTDSLLQTIRELHKNGISKFLIPLTLGYTVGGTNDNIPEILLGLRNLKKSITCEYFLWIDAALSGLTMPFLDTDYRSFFPDEIGTVVVDFHKILGVPMPAGLVLYRQKLSEYIKSTVPYLSVSDSTLLGSRNGVAPIAAWMSIHQLGFTKLKQLLQKEIRRKNKVLKEVSTVFPKAKIKTDLHSVHAAITVTEELPQSFCDRYGLKLRRYKINDNNYLVYPVFFLPEWS